MGSPDQFRSVCLGLCVLLRRLAYPNRLVDLQPMFGKSIPDLSLIFNAMINHVHHNFGERLTSLDQWWLDPDHLEQYAGAIHLKGSPLHDCVGFIDGDFYLY